MITRVVISGLGPHRLFQADLAPRGTTGSSTTTLSGPSEAGKTTFLEAIRFALWGRGGAAKAPAAWIRDGMEAAEVEIHLADGTRLHRRVDRDRGVTRRIFQGGDVLTPRTEADFQRVLGPWGADPEAADLVLTPLAWQPLVAANARRFRDVLARVLPGGDPVAAVQAQMAGAGLAVSEREAGWTEREATSARREARRERDEAAGRMQAIADQLARLAAEPPAGPEDAALRAAEAAELTAAEALQASTERWKEASRRRQAIDEQLSAFDKDSPDTCPTCRRGGWGEGAAAAAALREQAEHASGALQAALDAGRHAREVHNAARAALAAAREAAGARRQRQADHDRLQRELHALRQSAGEAAGEADRLDALLDAIRQAPSRVAARRAAALGDLGPVTLEFGENPAVVVLIDGRPWWLASRGRQVVADAWLRAALRRAMSLDDLPLILDNVQDVGGQPLPPLPGPVILLRTTDAREISVEQG